MWNDMNNTENAMNNAAPRARSADGFELEFPPQRNRLSVRPEDSLKCPCRFWVWPENHVRRWSYMQKKGIICWFCITKNNNLIIFLNLSIHLKFSHLDEVEISFKELSEFHNSFGEASCCMWWLIQHKAWKRAVIHQLPPVPSNKAAPKTPHSCISWHISPY